MIFDELLIKLSIRHFSLEIEKYALLKPEQQVVTSLWCFILIKAGFQPEKDEKIYLNAINSKSYFYEAVCEFFPLSSEFFDVTKRVSEDVMTSF